MKDIDRDAYLAWKDNEVTKRFMAEIAEDLDGVEKQRIYGDQEQMLRTVHERNAMIDIFENIIGWKPGNLIEENE